MNMVWMCADLSSWSSVWSLCLEQLYFVWIVFFVFVDWLQSGFHDVLNCWYTLVSLVHSVLYLLYNVIAAIRQVLCITMMCVLGVHTYPLFWTRKNFQSWNHKICWKTVFCLKDSLRHWIKKNFFQGFIIDKMAMCHLNVVSAPSCLDFARLSIFFRIYFLKCKHFGVVWFHKISVFFYNLLIHL